MKIPTLALFFLSAANANNCDQSSCVMCYEKDLTTPFTYSVAFEPDDSKKVTKDTGFYKPTGSCSQICKIFNEDDSLYNGRDLQLGKTGEIIIGHHDSPAGQTNKIKVRCYTDGSQAPIITSPLITIDLLAKCHDKVTLTNIEDIVLKNKDPSKDISMTSFWSTKDTQCAPQTCDVYANNQKVESDISLDMQSSYTFKPQTAPDGYVENYQFKCTDKVGTFVESNVFKVTLNPYCNDYWTVDTSDISLDLKYDDSSSYKAQFPISHADPVKCPLDCDVIKSMSDDKYENSDISYTAADEVENGGYSIIRSHLGGKSDTFRFSCKSSYINNVLRDTTTKKFTPIKVSYKQSANECYNQLSAKSTIDPVDTTYTSSAMRSTLVSDIASKYFEVPADKKDKCRVNMCTLHDYTNGACIENSYTGKMEISSTGPIMYMTTLANYDNGFEHAFCIKCQIDSLPAVYAKNILYTQKSACALESNFKAANAKNVISVPIKQQWSSTNKANPVLDQTKATPIFDANTGFTKADSCPIKTCIAYKEDCKTPFDSSMVNSGNKFYLKPYEYDNGKGSQKVTACFKCSSGPLGREDMTKVEFKVDSVCKDSVLPIMIDVKKSYNPKKYQTINNKKTEIFQTVKEAKKYSHLVGLQDEEATTMVNYGSPLSLMAKQFRFAKVSGNQQQGFQGLCQPQCYQVAVGCQGFMSEEDSKLTRYSGSTDNKQGYKGSILGDVKTAGVEVNYCLICKMGQQFDSPVESRDNMKYSIISKLALIIGLCVGGVILLCAIVGGAGKYQQQQQQPSEEQPAEGVYPGPEVTNQVGQEGAETGRGMVDEYGNPVEGQFPVQDLENQGEVPAEEKAAEEVALEEVELNEIAPEEAPEEEAPEEEAPEEEAPEEEAQEEEAQEEAPEEEAEE